MLHEFKTQVQDSQIDSFGHVNNASYLSILEEARWDWISKAGLTKESVRRDQIGTVILEMNLRFSKEILPKENLRIETEIIESKTRLYRIEQRIFNSDNELCTVAKILFGFFDLKRRKLITAPESWLALVNA